VRKKRFQKPIYKEGNSPRHPARKRNISKKTNKTRHMSQKKQKNSPQTPGEEEDITEKMASLGIASLDANPGDQESGPPTQGDKDEMAAMQSALNAYARGAHFLTKADVEGRPLPHVNSDGTFGGEGI
jgi:hypothetical protein